MKICTAILICLFLLLPIMAIAEYKVPIKIEGHIGDYTKKSRNYEIDGKIYHFQENITIENQNGKKLGFNALKGGCIIKVIGEQNINSGSAEEPKFHKIIINKK